MSKMQDKKCPKCGDMLRHIFVENMDGDCVGEYYYCHYLVHEDYFIQEKGCGYRKWVKKSESCFKPKKEKNNRKVFGEKKCAKCNGPIGFYKNENNKWVPCELDGDDHWDICRENLITGRYGIKKEFKINNDPIWTFRKKERKTS